MSKISSTTKATTTWFRSSILAFREPSTASASTATLSKGQGTILMSRQPNLDYWFGPSYISVVMNQLFIGILCGQIWTYYSYFPKDPTWMKRLVGLTSCLLIFNTAHSVRMMWQKSIMDFANWERAVQIGWDLCLQRIATTTITCSAQVFFIWRCYALTGWNRYLLTVLIATFLAELTVSVGLSVELKVDPHDVTTIEKWGVPRYIITVVLDVAITATVSYKLFASRRGDNRNTDIVLKKLLTVVWKSALPPTIVQITAIVIHFSVPGTGPGITFLINQLTAGLYAFSLMYTLNSRLEIRKFSLTMHSNDYTERTAGIVTELSEIRFRRDRADLSMFSTFDRRDQSSTITEGPDRSGIGTTLPLPSVGDSQGDL